MTETKSMMDSLPDLPPDTQPLDHQVAGHFYGRSKTKYGLLQQRSTGNVLKPLLNPPRGPREHQFYLDLFTQQISPEIGALRSFLPKYLGTYEHSQMTYLILENILEGYEKPCVMDIKLGRVTYDHEATEEKIKRQINKFQPASEIGFQILGWKTYSVRNQSYVYHDKQCARSLSKDELLYGMANFFGAPERDHRAIVRAVLERLVRLEEAMAKQHEFVFIASSILIVYDGKDRRGEEEEEEGPVKVDVRLVDFAHVFPSTTHKADENLLFGLKHCVKYLQRLLDENFVYESIEKIDHQANCSPSTCAKTFLE